MPYTVVGGDNLWSIWSRMGGGMSWADFKNLNAHLQRGTNQWGLIYPGDVVKLAGDAAPAAPAPAPVAPRPRAPAPAPAPAAPSPTEMFLEPGMWQAIEEERLELQRQIAAELARLDQERIEQERWAIEARLAVEPIDFVAYELYKRELEAQGLEPKTGAAATDPDIQAMVAQITGAEGGAGYAGEFGTYIPTTQQWTRSGFKDVSPNEMAIISSFLKAGLTPEGGTEFSYDPQEYFREMEEGFIPFIQTTGPTRYQF